MTKLLSQTKDDTGSHSKKIYLLKLNEKQPKDFWDYIGKLGVAHGRSTKIPFEVVNPDGHMSREPEVVMERWRNNFQDLLNPASSSISTAAAAQTPQFQPSRIGTDVNNINVPICKDEIIAAMRRTKNGKATGGDKIAIETPRNGNCVDALHALFNNCFLYGQVPDSWQCGIIGKGPRVLGNYRGITITSVVYKLYCSVLLHRLERWVDVNDLLVDEQNGFRRGRSCVDHISSLTSIIETRKLMKKWTYAAFIDYSKAYNRINRNMLFSKLSALGLKGNFYESMKDIYSNVRCSVKVNGVLSNSFNVSSGLKQGCLLSPMLFNLYLNVLAVKLKSLGCGIDIDGEVVPIILYADDIVLLAENEQDLQQLLNVLNEWCKEWDMVTNLEKSNVVHFRNSSVPRTNCEFHIGNLDNNKVQVVDRYRYLGIVLNEFLDFSVTAEWSLMRHTVL